MAAPLAIVARLLAARRKRRADEPRSVPALPADLASRVAAARGVC
jgi:hypothetical protein